MSAFVYFEPELRQKKESFSLTSSENDHLVKVMRAAEGDEITLFDGKGYFATAAVKTITKSTATLALTSNIQFQAQSSKLILAQALVRSSKMDWIIEKAVELGVSQLEFVRC